MDINATREAVTLEMAAFGIILILGALALLLLHFEEKTQSHDTRRN